MNLSISAGTVLSFALVLSRVSGVFVFMPLPVKDATPVTARALFSVAATLALFPRWPTTEPADFGLGQFVIWLASEAVFGVAAGLLVGFLAEALTMSAQLVGLQAGYGYASVVDPTTQADSDVLQVVARLMSGLLFFTLGLDHEILRALALSLDHRPPGSFTLTLSLVEAVIALGSQIFALGLRLAFPVLGLLLLSEITLALIGRLNSQLQLGSASAPLKMLLTLAALATLLKVTPSVYSGYAGQAISLLRRI